MPLTINGADGNPFTGRDMDGTPDNFITTLHVVTPSGVYPAGGDTLDLTTITAQVPSSTVLAVEPIGQANTAGTSITALGWYYAVVQGATLATWKIQIWQVGAGGQLGAGAYPATVTNDKLLLRITWRKLL